MRRQTLALPDFFEDLKDLRQRVNAVIVHGGGPAISGNLEKLGIETEFVNGLRKTTEDVLDVVEMVLAGTINKQIVRRIQSVGGSAIGLSGSDGGLIEAKPVTNHAEVGWVGDVTFVKSSILSGVLDMGYMPWLRRLGWIVRSALHQCRYGGWSRCSPGVHRMIVVTDVPGS